MKNKKNRTDSKTSSYYYDDKSPLTDIKDNQKPEMIGLVPSFFEIYTILQLTVLNW